MKIPTYIETFPPHYIFVSNNRQNILIEIVILQCTLHKKIMNNSDANTFDCGDNTSTYDEEKDCSKNTEIEEPDDDGELDYLVCLVSSSEEENKIQFNKLVNLALLQSAGDSSPPSGLKKQLT